VTEVALHLARKDGISADEDLADGLTSS